jgi:hypothetical protein
MASILRSLDETQLRSLKFSEFTGREPFVLKDVDTKLERGIGLKQQISRRGDDLVRITKLLASGPGLKFIGHNALLSFAENQKSNDKFGLKVLSAGKSVASTLATILAQVPVSGTGAHFSADELAGTTYFERNSKTKLRQPNGRFVKGNTGQELSLTTQSELTEIKTFEGTKVSDFKNVDTTKTNLQRTQEQVKQLQEEGRDRLNNSIDVTLKMGGSQVIQSTRGTSFSTDQVNYLDVETADLGTYQDIIPFKINIRTSAPESSFFLYFRAYLEDLTDNFRGEWNSFKYIGRGENFYNYNGFDRTIGISFKIAAISKIELLPLYKKLNYLVGSTAPTYGTLPEQEDTEGVKSSFMTANYINLTIGDYLDNVPGFFESIDLSWDKTYPWEIKKGRPGISSVNIPDEERALPHVLDVRAAFRPIHNFAPELKQVFIGKQFDEFPRTDPATPSPVVL